MKPIEPGCKALVIKAVRIPELVGTAVDVIEKSFGDKWVIDSDLLTDFRDFPDQKITSSEKVLMRIDGNEEEFLREQSDKLIEA